MLRNGYPERASVGRLSADAVVRSMVELDRRFLRANAASLDYYASRWVPDPMHNWSRPWEYLYTHERILSFAGRAGTPALRLLDAGSGLTFFPHFLADRYGGFRVECIDDDERLVADAAHLVPPADSRVRYRTGRLESLDPSLGPFDCIYCVSVLEHVRDSAAAIESLSRLLRPGGRLVLTIDVSLSGDAEIPMDAAVDLVDALGRVLEPEASYRTALTEFDGARHYTTEDARQSDPTLLPWAPPRFHLLSCFGMTFARPS